MPDCRNILRTEIYLQFAVVSFSEELERVSSTFEACSLPANEKSITHKYLLFIYAISLVYLFIWLLQSNPMRKRLPEIIMFPYRLGNPQ